MKKIIYLFIAITILSCSSQEKKLPESFDFGKTENGIYKNDYFNMEIPFNPDWVVQDKQEMSNLVEQGTDLIAGGNENLKSALKSSQISTAYLLTVFKHEIGAPVEYNPSLVVVAENNNNFPGIKNGRDYLFHVKKLMKQTQIEYLFEKDVFEKTIGSSSGHILEIKVEQFGTTIIQEYIATLKKGFNVSFIISYTTEEEKNELYEIIDNIKL